AALGVRADALELPVPLDRDAHAQALRRLKERNLVDAEGRLTAYGRAVEALPVEREWAELIVHAEDALLPFLAVGSAIESLHRMTREERDLEGVLVPGSDHLTAYSLYAEAYREAGFVGEVYGLSRHLFHAEPLARWADRRGVLVKAVEDAALAMASVYRSVGRELPERMPSADEDVHRRFADLLACFIPFDLVVDELTAEGEPARVAKTSVCGSFGAVAGTIRYFADRHGVTHASIEGTQVPLDLLRKYARRSGPEVAYDAFHRSVVLLWSLEHSGFELERDVEVLAAWGPELARRARRVLAEALARGEAHHAAVRRNQPRIDEVREVWRRSGGRTPRLGEPELTALYEALLEGVSSMEDFLTRGLELDLEALVPPEVREPYLSLPGTVSVREQDVGLVYDVEEDVEGEPRGFVWLDLPEKLARTLVEEELPELDLPVRFRVRRGRRGAVRADSLYELQDALELPWTPDELEQAGRGGHGGRRQDPS
ncbi:DEAD/DEAH box helicase, partial [Pyxidicoccus sp. 3LG]